jgi:hypothetical protein
MVWLDDNPDRSSVNRTNCIMRSILKVYGAEPVRLNQDGTADFTPYSPQVRRLTFGMGKT